MYYEIVVRIAAAFFYCISSVTFVGDFTKKLLNRICPNLHRILRLFMLICQTEFIIRAILTECRGIFDETRGLKNDIEVYPVHPGCGDGEVHFGMSVSLEVIKIAIQRIYNSSSSRKE